MTDKRLLYRVILKLLAAAGIIALLSVFLNAAFNSGPEGENTQVVRNEVITLKLAQVTAREATHVMWNGQRVGVIKREGASQMQLLSATSQKAMTNEAALDQHPWRSLDVSYFVYLDKGDSGHCPLFFNGSVFKDTCTGTRFDLAGRQMGGAQLLAIPPHYYAQAGQLVVGRWAAE